MLVGDHRHPFAVSGRTHEPRPTRSTSTTSVCSTTSPPAPGRRWAAAGCSACSAGWGGRAGRLRRRRDHGRPTRPARPADATGRPAVAAATGGDRVASRSPTGEIPEETAGPYPGDGSNGPNVLTESRHRAQRHHAAASASPSGVADGVPMTVRLKVYDLAGDDVDAAGGRGDLPVALRPRRQLLDVRRRRGGRELPARRAGGRRRRRRRVHHDLPAAATPAGGRTCTSRSTSRSTQATSVVEQAAHLAARLPAGRLRGGLRHRGLRGVGANLAGVSLDSDGIFSDGYSLQMAAVKGSVDGRATPPRSTSRSER